MAGYYIIYLIIFLIKNHSYFTAGVVYNNRVMKNYFWLILLTMTIKPIVIPIMPISIPRFGKKFSHDLVLCIAIAYNAQHE